MENIKIRSFEEKDINGAIEIWNSVVEDGIAFPQDETLNIETGLEFFNSQSFVGVAYDIEDNKIVGLYILHPNNVGRCGHICNSSFAVKKNLRGQHIGEKLVKHCIVTAKQYGFKIIQFNAVVESNIGALKLYEKLGFTKLGTIPNGFATKSGKYENIIPHYLEL